MLDELRQLGIGPEDIRTVTHAASLAEAQARLDALKARARSRYHQLALELHPDRTNGDASKAEAFRRVDEIYRAVSELRPLIPQTEPVNYNGISVSFCAA